MTHANQNQPEQPRQTYCRSCGVLQNKENSAINTRAKKKISFVRNCHRCEARRVLKINMTSVPTEELYERISKYESIISVIKEELANRKNKKEEQA